MTLMFKPVFSAAIAALGLACSAQAFAESTPATEVADAPVVVIAAAAQAAAPAAAAATAADKSADLLAGFKGQPWMPKQIKFGVVGASMMRTGDAFNAIGLTDAYIAARKTKDTTAPIPNPAPAGIAAYSAYNMRPQGQESGGYQFSAAWKLRNNFDLELGVTYVPRMAFGLTYKTEAAVRTSNADISTGIPLSSGGFITVGGVRVANDLRFEHKYADAKATVLYNFAGNELIKPYIGVGLTVAKYGSIVDASGNNGASLNRALFAINQLSTYNNTVASRDTFMTAGPMGSVRFKDDKSYNLHVVAGANFDLWEKSSLNVGVNLSRGSNKIIMTRNAYSAGGVNYDAKTVEMPVRFTAYQLSMAWVKRF